MKKSELKQLIKEEIQKTSNENIFEDTTKWKKILIPFYKEVIQTVGEPNMSLNIYSRWVSDFIINSNTYKSYDFLVKYGFRGVNPKTNEDLKDQLVRFIKLYY